MSKLAEPGFGQEALFGQGTVPAGFVEFMVGAPPGSAFVVQPDWDGKGMDPDTVMAAGPEQGRGLVERSFTIGIIRLLEIIEFFITEAMDPGIGFFSFFPGHIVGPATDFIPAGGQEDAPAAIAARPWSSLTELVGTDMPDKHLSFAATPVLAVIPDPVSDCQQSSI